MIRLLTFTSLYPSAAQPLHGLFVEERLRRIVASGEISATVMAPVPWFPFRGRIFGRYSTLSAVPANEVRHGLRIAHPRYPVMPKCGMNLAPALMYRALLHRVRKAAGQAPGYDLIDAHYFYPDGVAAVRMGLHLGKPVVVSARGSDINLLPEFAGPRRRIVWAARNASAIIAVSEALKRRLVELGINGDKVTVLRNGVDLKRFRPLDRLAIRSNLGLKGPTWVYVGNLVETKGVHLLIAALAEAADVTLLVIGTGPEQQRLQTLAAHAGVGERVRFAGAVDNEDLCQYYNAADALVLASSREGMPNVVLEALACGTPVIASDVGGIPEIIQSPEVGELVHSRTPAALVNAWHRLQSRQPERTRVRAHAEQFGWDATVRMQRALYTATLYSADKAANLEAGVTP